MEKIVFLDVDDTINSHCHVATLLEQGLPLVRVLELLHNKPKDSISEDDIDTAHQNLNDPYKVALIKALCEITGAKIIWQTAWDVPQIKEFLHPVTGIDDYTHPTVHHVNDMPMDIPIDEKRHDRTQHCEFIAEKLNTTKWVYFDDSVGVNPERWSKFNLFAEISLFNFTKACELLGRKRIE